MNTIQHIPSPAGADLRVCPLSKTDIGIEARI